MESRGDAAGEVGAFFATTTLAESFGDAEGLARLVELSGVSVGQRLKRDDGREQ